MKGERAMKKKRILIVEDNGPFRETTAAFLEGEGFRIDAAPDGSRGLDLALKEEYDLILLDIVLPGLSGYEVCRALREKRPAVPMIMLTGQKKDEVDKVVGLDLGADDYMTKPFGQRELLARIQAVLRRTSPDREALEACSFDDIKVDFKRKTATKGGAPLKMTAKEYGLLELLVAREGEVVSRETILNEVWGYERFPTTRTVDTFIHNLRHKIERDPAAPVHLLTVPWLGYRFQK
jgi:two-component system alkaline phosphatase synthesis response regulator PhoP